MSKAIFIDAEKREISVIDINGLDDMNKAVQGGISLAHQFPNGDTLYVDDEGAFTKAYGFHFPWRTDQSMYGNGILVGKEILYDAGNKFRNADVSMFGTPDQMCAALRGCVRFCVIEEF